MRTNIVLIDSENVQPDSIERLKQDHFKVVVFVGSNQKRIDISVVKAVQALGSKNRPGTVTKLKNAVAAHFLKMLSEEEVSAIINAMQVSGRIVVNGAKVTYPERG